LTEEIPTPPSSAAPPTARVRVSKDLLAGVSLVALALLALWAGADLEMGSRRAVGPGALPRAVALLILGGGVVMSIAALVKRGEPLGRWPLRGPIFVSLAIAAFALTIRSFGLAIAGPVVVLVSGAASPETRPMELVVLAVVMTAFCIGLFRYALGLPIPVLVIPGVIYI
jgi:putative tricarboxylic transport membrane protein